MKLLGIDIETTGVDPNKSQMLELGIVLYDTDVHGTDLKEIHLNALPSLRLINMIHPDHIKFQGHVAKQINTDSGLMNIIETYHNDSPERAYKLASNHFGSEVILSDPKDIKKHVFDWLFSNGLMSLDEYNKKYSKTKLTVCGKNFYAFDEKFIRKYIFESELPFGYRYLDPVALYTDLENDDSLANLQVCKDRFWNEFVGKGILNPGVDEYMINKVVYHSAVNDAFDTLLMCIAKMLISNMLKT